MPSQEFLLPHPSERFGAPTRNQPPPPPPPRAESSSPPRYRRELLIFLGLLAFGLFIVPLLIWAVGQRILGPYTNGGAFTLLMDFFNGLKSGSLAFWAVVLGPYVFVLIFRTFWYFLQQADRV